MVRSVGRAELAASELMHCGVLTIRGIRVRNRTVGPGSRQCIYAPQSVAEPGAISRPDPDSGRARRGGESLRSGLDRTYENRESARNGDAASSS